MTWLSLRSLRAKLQLFALLLVAVPGTILTVLAVMSARDAVERAVGRQLSQIAGDVVGELAEAVDDARAMAAGWAQLDVMRDVLIGDLDKRLARFFQTLADGGAPYLEIYAVDQAGHVVAASDPRILLPGGAPGDAELTARALRGETAFAGPAALPHGGNAVVIATPIRDLEHPATVNGALVACYDWRHAMARTDRIRRSLLFHHAPVDVLVLDRGGAIAGEAWRDGLDEATKERLRAVTRELAPRLEGSRGFVVSDAAEAVVGWARSDRPEQRLAVVLDPTADAFAPVRRLQRGLTGTLVGVLVAALAIATLLAGRMSRPLRELTRATQTLVRPGEAPQPVPVRSHDEIGTLALAFNEMGSALARAQEDLLTAAKFAFVGEVAAGIAHEVRTPLGIMRSSAQLLARTVPPGATESVELAQMIVGEVDRIARVVDGLLELARPRQPRLEPTGLAPILQRALDFAVGQARERGVALRGDFVPAPAARCDSEQIYQVALNLVVNAIQVLPRGGHLVVRTLPRRGRTVGFEVEDDGPGIPPDLRERIFTPFVSARPGGTGLGLALVQRIVQAHHGAVTVTSEVGRGTTFRVELPIAEGDA